MKSVRPLHCLSVVVLCILCRTAVAQVVTEFVVNSEDTPYAITAGPDGNLWFSSQVKSTSGR